VVANVDRYRVLPGAQIELNEWDPGETVAFEGDKKAGKEAASAYEKRLGELQELLYAEGKHKLLVVLQALDTGGKDSTIRRVFKHANVQGVKVASFGAPTEAELAHDYLWRIHKHTPGRGEIAVFNRSHYEDVLVVRVRNLVAPEVWARRYEHINAFEKMLADEGTTIRKFFLYIGKDEQKERLQDRLDDPTKHWKFRRDDLEDRKRWDDYMAAYAEALSRTSTDFSPWYVIPANRKWYRDLLVAQVVVDALESLEMRYPEPEPDLDKVAIE
jgi:PPK2 family polyphosphate:nucleotide phosphotransferase